MGLGIQPRSRDVSLHTESMNRLDYTVKTIMKTGKGKNYAGVGAFIPKLAMPIMVRGRLVRLYRIPEESQERAVRQVLELELPAECGVGFVEYNGAAVFVGMLQGKLVPCMTTEASGPDVEIVAAELQRRLEEYAAEGN